MAKRYIEVEVQVIASLEQKLVYLKLATDTKKTQILQLINEAIDNNEEGNYERLVEVGCKLADLSQEVIRGEKSQKALERVITEVIDGTI